jgi:hypothetical protein
MATFEQEQPFVGRPLARPDDPHVFVSATGHRARLVRAVGIGAGVAALAWLTALGFALLGVGSLPGLVPGAKATRHGPTAVRTTHVVPAAPRLQVTRSAVWAPSSRSATRERHGAAPVTARAPASAPPTTTAPTQGWAKHGWTAPPGQVQHAPTTPPGNGNGHGRDTAPGQSATPPGRSGSHAAKNQG